MPVDPDNPANASLALLLSARASDVREAQIALIRSTASLGDCPARQAYHDACRALGDLASLVDDVAHALAHGCTPFDEQALMEMVDNGRTHALWLLEFARELELEERESLREALDLINPPEVPDE